ncbi:MAG: hybrid sensor histidine kinase/response regulator [Coleofasciculaceae cyanobacterium]
MLNKPTTILVIEDDIQDLDLLEEFLARAKNFSTVLKTAESLAEGIRCLEQEEIDVVLSDLSLPDEYGLGTFRRLHDQFPQIPIIILSGLDNEEMAVTALSEGAQDYLLKGNFKSDLLARSIRYAIERQQIRLTQEQQADLLELRVKERTAELEKANLQLQALETQLRQSLAQEKELSHLKTRIITRISHEYRTPLTTILSSMELVEAYYHKWSEERLNKHFQRVRNSIQHLTALVNDVLFVSKAEFEKMEFQPQQLELVSFFTEIVEEMQVDVSEKHYLKFVTDQQKIKFWGDGKLLRQILTNLVSNAIKYSPQGGDVLIQLVYEDKQVRFSVQDQGIGIPEEDKARLFESFSRASNVGEIRGTGLGLSIVKKSIERHSGEIIVESKVGMGTTFTVSLPNQDIDFLNGKSKLLVES